MGAGARLYNHNLSHQAVRGSVGKYKVVPHVLPSPKVAFQPAACPGELASAFSLADCGYEDDVLLSVGWSLKPAGELLIPVKDAPLFWAFATNVTVNPKQHVHLRQ